MDTDDIEAEIEAAIPDADATATTPRDPDDDEHYAVDVVSPAFAGESVLDQHDMVHDALEEYLTTEIHAIEVTTRTPGDD